MSGPFKLRSGNATPFKELGSSPAKQQSYSEKKDVIDQENIDKMHDPNKPGGLGAYTEDKGETTESIRRQATRDAQNKTRKELQEDAKAQHKVHGNVKTSKGKKLHPVTGGRNWWGRTFTSTKKLRSEATARAARDANKARGQDEKREDVVNE